MDKKIIFISRILVVCMSLGLFFSSITSIDVVAANFNLQEYETVIEQVNTTYNKKFAITDSDAFTQNVCNKITPKEFEEMLICNAIHENAVQTNIEVIVPQTRATNEVIKYSVPITYGSWESRLNARIETTFFSTGTPKFIRYIDAGYAWDDNWTTWLFKAHEMKCESFSSSTCKVSYKGYWTIPRTGVTDLTYLTYNITYYAG